jgi:hypothetical protein
MDKDAETAGGGRSFAFAYQGRALAIRAIRFEDAWELWIFDADRRLAYGGRVLFDDALEALRHGEDRIKSLAEEIKGHVLTAKLELVEAGPATQGHFARILGRRGSCAAT